MSLTSFLATSDLPATLLLAQDAIYRDPTRFTHFEFTNRMYLHPVGLTMMVIAIISLLAVSRRNAIVPIVLLLCFVPPAQRIVVSGIDFQFLRILGLFGLIRILINRESKGIRWRAIDLVMVAVTLWQVLLVFPRGVSFSFMNTVGQGFDTLSMYLIGRCLIRDRGDLTRFAQVMFLVSIPVLVAFVIEKMTARNFFSVFGGVPEITALRQGKLRVQGAFAHPILAGVWWAAMLPIFISMYRAASSRSWGRMIALVGAPISLVLAFLTASSTPVGGAIIAIGLWIIYPYRFMIVRARWLILGFLTVLHFLSQSGLHGILLTRITLVAGSTGWHRYRLIDAAIDRMPEWFLLGTRSTYHWGWGLDDVTCQYVAAAVAGGILGLAALVYVIGAATKAAYSIGVSRPRETWRQWMAWGLVVSIAVHAICFVAVTYFGQAVFLYSFTIGMAVALSESLRRRPSPVAQPVPEPSPPRDLKGNVAT